MGNATFAQSTGRRPHRVRLGRREELGTITFSNSYATGGDTLVMSTVPMDRVTDLLVEGGPNATTTAGYQIKLAGTTTEPKIIAYNTAGQIANATNLSTVAVRVRLVGY